ncbi:MAG: purine-nucleoside phosphorylase [Acidimicrobiia bacterium]|nr:purine-nucleoside phosphorylase [Acidimicrobiia bacterium]
MTPHISADPGDFAPICLLPGDPLRARYVAEHHLDDARLVTSVRNMEGYTGTYRGTPISVMGSGMGIPSASIYATELITKYDVGTIIRIGSCGGIQPFLGLGDVIIAVGASTDSNVNRMRFRGYDFAALADFGVTRALVETAEAKGETVHAGNIISSDLFYHPDVELFGRCGELGILGAEMEAAGLFGLAAEHGARAGALMTVTDLMAGGDEMTPEERQTSLDAMIEIALEASVSLG